MSFRIAVVCLLFAPAAVAAERIPDTHRIGGFAVGPQAYSFRFFTLFEAIEKTQQTGAKVIELGTGQKISADNPTVFNHEAPADLIPLVQATLKQHGIIAVNYGVARMPDEATARKVFAFAKAMGLPAIITESIESIDIIEKLARDYDIKVGIHQHAKRPNKTDYKLWDPAFVRDLVKNRDPRIGACADIGHWQTSGIRAIDGLKILEGRIISLHLKERAALGPNQTDTIFGTGITDMGGILAELRRQKFDGNLAIEYEYNWHHSVPDIAQCIGFIRGWTAANPK